MLNGLSHENDFRRPKFPLLYSIVRVETRPVSIHSAPGPRSRRVPNLCRLPSPEISDDAQRGACAAREAKLHGLHGWHQAHLLTFKTRVSNPPNGKMNETDTRAGSDTNRQKFWRDIIRETSPKCKFYPCRSIMSRSAK